MGIPVGVWLSPIIPNVTDSHENIAQVVEAAVESGAKFVLGGVLDLRGSVHFKKFLEEHFAQFVPRYDWLYKGKRTRPSCGDMDESYVYWVYSEFIHLCQKYEVESYIPHFCSRKQALFFYVRNFSRFKGTPIFELTQALNFLFPSKEFLQTVRIKFGDQAISRSFLKVLGYFPR
jgi:DNA repair photolyase